MPGSTSTCKECNLDERGKLIHRCKEDANELIFHTVRIANGNSMMQDGMRRDQIREQQDGALCIGIPDKKQRRYVGVNSTKL
ncbi:hypothetical protein BJ170DRAFT_645606 [Xylariales sp. AK1849]|nr:hypothetical protein BJ170DRAFT_645606 [Xylariales sp. AK1849]